MHTRISQLISSLGIKKVDFAKRLKISQPFVSELCSGKSSPSDRTITDICREFNVNELWLRHGDGEMFVEKNPDEEIEAFMLSVLRGQSDSFKHRFAKVIATMTEDEWALLERKIKELQEP